MESSAENAVRWRRQRKTPDPKPPEFLEEAAALRRFHHLATQRRHNATLAQLLELPPQQRATALATLRAEAVEEEMKAEGKCHHCMLLCQYCICDSIEQIRSEKDPSLTLRFVVWMHHKERRRASNTGKLLKLLMPHQTDILVHGVAEDEERLQELISNQSYFCFVVYPSEDAVPVSTISSTLGLQKCSKIPVAVLIDGTWNQAQRMHKHFEEMQHVIVFPTGHSQFHWRRQSQEGRISTVEAAALVMEELTDESDRGDTLRKSLAVLMDALGRQCHHDTLFQHHLPEPTGKKKYALGAKQMQKILPGHRGYK